MGPSPFEVSHYLVKPWTQGLQLCRPLNPEELFNLHHAFAHNMVERIFGIMKQCFKIIVCPPEYDLDIQAHIPLAMAALHNFICRNDPDKIYDFNEVGLDLDPRGDVGVLAVGLPGPVESGEAQDRHTEVARLMWAQYKVILENRA